MTAINLKGGPAFPPSLLLFIVSKIYCLCIFSGKSCRFPVAFLCCCRRNSAYLCNFLLFLKLTDKLPLICNLLMAILCQSAQSDKGVGLNCPASAIQESSPCVLSSKTAVCHLLGVLKSMTPSSTKIRHIPARSI